MKLTDIRINLCPGPHNVPYPGTGHNAPMGQRLRAFCSMTFDNTFVIHDVKLIDGNGGLFLAMPSRKLSDHCPGCGEKNHLRARFCNGCGRRLDEDRAARLAPERGTTGQRVKLHTDIVHPINAACRRQIENQVFRAYWSEVDRSRQPGYVPPAQSGLDQGDGFFDSVGQAQAACQAGG
jgi:stage V sporulation protein G